MKHTSDRTLRALLARQQNTFFLFLLSKILKLLLLLFFDHVSDFHHSGTALADDEKFELFSEGPTTFRISEIKLWSSLITET